MIDLLHQVSHGSADSFGGYIKFDWLRKLSHAFAENSGGYVIWLIFSTKYAMYLETTFGGYTK